MHRAPSPSTIALLRVATLVAFACAAPSALGCAAGSADAFDDDGGPSFVDGGAGSSTAADDDASYVPPDGACEGPLGPPMNPATLSACCPDFGHAHCFPTPKVPGALQKMLSTCDGSGGSCVPDVFLKTGGVYTPPACKSLGGPGVCLSQCIPLVAEKAALLPQDVCADDEKCVPCINPLDHTSTHACELKGTCNGDDAGAPIGEGEAGPPVDSGPPVCPHVGPPVIDPTKLPSCQCPDAHCVPGAAVPAAEASKLAACTSDPAGKCVPDAIISSGGDLIPATCASIGSHEGRCLSTCLPDVMAKLTELPQSTCGTYERCVPCYDPISLKETGACRLSCDPGPKDPPPPPAPKCCSGRGTCVPSSAVPASSAKSLKKDKCPAADLCAPDVFIDKTWKRVDCTASLFLLGELGPGVCMPECINGMNALLLKGACGDGEKCAPCKDPLTGKDTGACSFSP